MPGFVQRFTCLAGKACTQGWLAGRPGSRALWVKLAKMLDVPGIAHWDGIFGLQADYVGPGDSRYPIRAFPLRRQLVGILGPTERAEEQGRLPQSFGHEPCGYGSGARLAGSKQLTR